ncbi:PREDICTED: putative 1-phosphatidylinositol-3-phosphate 5-kinase FAB1D isoform X1 [Lupinus angustifolius]|uniref:putative 1-phosphatidylinositol-3-phosphate 5-kinase FAB1D isoform X1 n=2 Tax=Lupinus angustifolius TaxID=3871 RepID=UPI00092E90D3|nr:PREDICTED: putative 1-phosphatidylinositol-3-phosphate 5-kinase FAB1D isoform X1 [Lupinus angustifolius]XP_019452736.1 PREDICTED: putative 1-phosphatidylinositol-3-phosphate 5-kinase FAB1D isoform X1 [Lupinus angustifolius]
MCSMCHYCAASLTESNVANKKLGNDSSLKLNGEVLKNYCKFCGEKLERENVKRDSTSPHFTPNIRPTASLTSTDSCVSTCSDLSVDVSSPDRISQEESTVEGVMEDLNYKLNGESQKVVANNAQESNNDNEGYTMRDVEILQGNNCLEAKADGSENTTASYAEETEYSLPDDLDTQTWEPPEPENPQDDMENSVTCNDDDDDEGIGIAYLGEPTFMSSSKDEVRFKEEKQRAMEEVMNGKFKGLVGQLLKSMGVSSCDEGDKSWVDIVMSLSWEAASFLKPGTIGGNAMNPDGYVKVKCIATGSCSQSELVKGLVFKKHASHKHMLTEYKNPRLLLISGDVGHSISGLSSFDFMDQEKECLKSKMGLIEMCHPNVILVEKTVSRDIQESILAKKMTLVLDMKLHRLQRISLCTGSPILSCDNLNGQKLRHCNFIYFKKFMEEHDGAGDGGKRPIKTLMFIEGCPTRLGCTILLKGTHSDELKKIKCVTRCAVVMAYNLILETSFLFDQKAMFSTIPAVKLADILPANQESFGRACVDSIIPSLEYSTENGLVSTDIPMCNGIHDKSTNDLNLESKEFSPLSFEPYNPAVFSGFSAISSSMKKVMGDSFPFASSAPYQSLSAYLGFNGRKPNDEVNKSISILDSLEVDENTKIEAKDDSNGVKILNGGQSLPTSVHFASNARKIKDGDIDRKEIQSKDDIDAVLDSQSILVLMSSRNALKGTVCQQSHFSHIMFYKNFDIPLGKFLQDNLLNQTRLCDTCQEFPEAHFYDYAHHNKQLTIQVKRLPQEKCLPGQAEGKLWMWSRCVKCKSNSTKRVLISTTARSLSFGKFLELSLSRYSSTRNFSCGHSLDRDFLYYFGLGHMVAMFRYSPVTTYTVSMPPHKLEFSGTIEQEWLSKETEKVYMKGISLFTEVANCLKTIRLDRSTLNLGGSIREFSEVEKMLKQEREEFEVNIKNAVFKKGDPDQAAFKLLSLNRLMWDLLIESCVWDRRLYSLHSHDRLRSESNVSEKVMQEHGYSKVEGTAGREIASTGNVMENSNINGGANVEILSDTSLEVNELPIKEIPISVSLLEGSEQDVPQNVKIPVVDDLRSRRSSDKKLNLSIDVFTQSPSEGGNLLEKDFVTSNHLQVESTDIQSSLLVNNSASLHSPVSILQDSNEWFWKPFGEIRQIGVRDFQKILLSKFESLSSSIIEYLPTANQLIIEEGTRLHIPLRTDNHIVSDYEGEPSSIIACALAFLKDSYAVRKLDEDDSRENGGTSTSIESLHDFIHGATLTSPNTFSSATDSDSVHSTGSTSSEESLSSRSLENHSGVEIAMGYAKSLGKEKYTVTCHYVNQFRELRNLCCLSELDYIACLSRCRNWDAKGGKSKSFFAKTFDDRFIIKEIKKTELDSFLGFSSRYFKHMRESFESGSQTCLSKVLGIYQVTNRHIKSGKEVKHDLMVMENLSYNRNITRQYDLKGALFARYTSAADGAGDVLLDQNFVNDMNSSPLYVSHKAKRLLQRAVWNDTTFLNSVNVMDYSLLVGVDSQKRQLVCGIIDFLRQYTWDKHLETWMKSSLVVPKNVLPTVISPIEYKKRFRKFMSTYFLSVPDHWCSQKSSNPCKLCGSREDDPSQQSS